MFDESHNGDRGGEGGEVGTRRKRAQEEEEELVGCSRRSALLGYTAAHSSSLRDEARTGEGLSFGRGTSQLIKSLQES